MPGVTLVNEENGKGLTEAQIWDLVRAIAFPAGQVIWLGALPTKIHEAVKKRISVPRGLPRATVSATTRPGLWSRRWTGGLACFWSVGCVTGAMVGRLFRWMRP